MKVYFRQFGSCPDEYKSGNLSNVINVCVRIKEHIVDDPFFGDYDVLQIRCISDGHYVEVDNVIDVEVE